MKNWTRSIPTKPNKHRRTSLVQMADKKFVHPDVTTELARRHRKAKKS